MLRQAARKQTAVTMAARKASAAAAAPPQASMAKGGAPAWAGSWISQKPSPPMAFMCG